MADAGDDLQPQQQKRVVVAIKATREISRTAIIWALTHVVQPGDCVTLLVVAPMHCSGRRLWGFPLFSGDCARLQPGTSLDQTSDITDLCSEMMHKLHDIYDPNKISIKVKIVPGLPCGSVAAESKRAQASWVILDKQLKNEEKHCMEELQCNIVVMKHAQAKVLRLNLLGSSEVEPEPKFVCTLTSKLDKSPEKDARDMPDSGCPIREPSLTPISSPEVGNLFSAGATEAGTSLSSSESATSPDTNEGLEKEEHTPTIGNEILNVTSYDSDNGTLSASVAPEFEPWTSEILSSSHISPKEARDLSQRLNKGTYISESQMNNRASVNIFENTIEAGASTSHCRLDPDFGGNSREAGTSTLSFRVDLKSNRNASGISNWKSISDPEFGSVREVVSLDKNAPAGSPPLCSICQHKVPVFGKPPRAFSYSELELATDGFSQANFLAEGGFGSVYRGILPDGQVIAVKQHKPASSQGDREFCSEVKVLSCAQHRNVVMLIGFCVEDKRRLLVYEYICNESLHSHLYDCTREPLAWSARQKIAVGAARGLRYLHEECRVGCIVHRDMRPNNILLTHEFHALVGDFGLARWQPDGDLAERTRVIGTIGYLAPEYSQTGEITEKTDVYSFGVVLVELISGCRAVDTSRPKGQRLLTEWARPLLEESAVHKLIDPRLGNSYSEHEVHCMSHAALQCIRHDPDSRPHISQVLRILEGSEPCNNLKSCHDSASRQQCSSPLQQKASWGYCKHSCKGSTAAR